MAPSPSPTRNNLPLDNYACRNHQLFDDRDRETDRSTAARRIPRNFGGLQSSATTSTLRNDHGIETLRYEETSAAEPPIPVIKSPPRQPPTDIHPALRRPRTGRPATAEEEWKRDSGLAPTTSSKGRDKDERSFVDSAIEEEELWRAQTIEEREARLGINIDFTSPSKTATPNLSVFTPPLAVELENNSRSPSDLGWRKKKKQQEAAMLSSLTGRPQESFSINTDIPTDSLIDEEALESMDFSKRGSMMLLGKKVRNDHTRPNTGRRQPSRYMLIMPNARQLPEEVEAESQKVRSMYEAGSDMAWEDGQYLSSIVHDRTGKLHPHSADHPELVAAKPGVNHPSTRPSSTLSDRGEYELAGGIEDWEDITVADVDRYGFIDGRPRSSQSRNSEPRRIQRVSTMLQLASDAPRPKRVLGKPIAGAASGSSPKKVLRKQSAKSLKTQGSSASSRSTSSQQMRALSNRLPGNRDRRWMDEAGDMLTLPPGLADIAEDEEGGKAADALKEKENERSKKWAAMAKVKTGSKLGGGMDFEFDPKNPKLIERVWKGIPDRWRGSAWYSFLAASAKKREDSVPDEHIIETFHVLMDQSSADDVQIDLDVPRTINSHIMFRRRYRGGQRLLFRVLHVLSLYFPETGYVQGMASLAATLLCYYDEERTFVMLVRMWTLRGLDILYESGFPGLMAALDEFKTKWINDPLISAKLDDLNIDPTAYGTRWYLTLFNYSIPFAAQLRVWDVFMLLGDVDPEQPATDSRPFQGCLDVLHAVSAALIDATRDILLDSDFENAMKTLTSWVPIKDEEMLMRVTRAEWKLHRKNRRV